MSPDSAVALSLLLPAPGPVLSDPISEDEPAERRLMTNSRHSHIREHTGIQTAATAARRRRWEGAAV